MKKVLLICSTIAFLLASVNGSATVISHNNTINKVYQKGDDKKGDADKKTDKKDCNKKCDDSDKGKCCKKNGKS